MSDDEPKMVELTFTMTEALVDVLTGLAFYCRCSKGEAICKAMALLNAYVEAHRKGCIVAVVDDEDELTELTGIVNEPKTG